MSRFVRYESGGSARYGALKGTSIQPLDGELGALRPSGSAPLALSEVKLLAPAVPTKIIAIGPNYRSTFAAAGTPPPKRPMFWTKPATCLNHPEGIIELPPLDHLAANHEVELAIVIGKRAKAVSRRDAENYIFGYTCMNDVTAGDFSTPGAFVASPYFVYGKIFDGFAPLGPCIESDLDVGNLHMECRVNGKVRQSHSTSDHLFNAAELVEMVSNILTLLPGDVISTGSPPGITPLRDGDVIEIEIENIGTLRNYARARTSPTQARLGSDVRNPGE
jgi:2-keto-4-pentenoate hydratase/2-oxohepta-3-ene-1,7-dioic acid hydratase in catechol pathway